MCSLKRKIKSRLKCCAGAFVEKEKDFFLSIEKFAISLNCKLIKLLEEKELLNQDSSQAEHHTRLLLDERKDYCVWSPTEVDMQELRVGSADRALQESGLQLHSQRMELHQANQFSDHSQRDQELAMHRIGQKRKISSRRSFEESSRNRRMEQVVLYRSLKGWEQKNFLMKRKKANLQWISSRLKFRNYKARWIPWTIPLNFMILNRQAVLGYPTFPVSLWVFRAFVECCRDSFLQPGISGNVFEDLFAPSELPAAFFEHFKKPCVSTMRARLSEHSDSSEGIGEKYQTFFTPRFASMFSTWNPPSHAEGAYPQNCMFEQPRNQVSEMHFDRIPLSFKTEVCFWSNFPTDALLWIKEAEMRSIGGQRFPNFEMLEAEIPSALKKIIRNPYFKKRANLEEQKAQVQSRLFRAWQIAYMIYEYFRVTGA